MTGRLNEECANACAIKALPDIKIRTDAKPSPQKIQPYEASPWSLLNLVSGESLGARRDLSELDAPGLGSELGVVVAGAIPGGKIRKTPGNSWTDCEYGPSEGESF